MGQVRRLQQQGTVVAVGLSGSRGKLEAGGQIWGILRAWERGGPADGRTGSPEHKEGARMTPGLASGRGDAVPCKGKTGRSRLCWRWEASTRFDVSWSAVTASRPRENVRLAFGYVALNSGRLSRLRTESDLRVTNRKLRFARRPQTGLDI